MTPNGYATPEAEEDANAIIAAGFAGPASQRTMGDLTIATDAEIAARDDDGWRHIDTAPKDGTPIQARIWANGSDNVIMWQDGLLDGNDHDCGSWCFASEQEPPACWTDGWYWAVNEDGEPSAKPTHWKPLPALVTQP
jgi:hypothetical protein